MKVTVLTKCAGHGLCAATAPHLFQLDADGYAVALTGGAIPEKWEGDAQDAAATCPEQAIEVEH